MGVAMLAMEVGYRWAMLLALAAWAVVCVDGADNSEGVPKDVVSPLNTLIKPQIGM